ncbi:MAG: VanW family protein [Selenomonadaceae bacterium]|nr:VanW family protein [Selenomonadaceae bacterium]
MFGKKRILFCEIHPVCYKISLQKEIGKRHLKDFFSGEKFANQIESEILPNIVSDCNSNLIKRAPGVELRLQENKAVNIQLACQKINGMIIHPNEVFSFWRTVGKPTRSKGYLDGRVIIKNKLIPGLGGGLCNLGNTIHRMILHSPLKVTEIHHHSDALAPDEGKRVPFSAGTSISYNYIDFRFKNVTDQNFQLLLWCKDEKLFGELRSEHEIPFIYRLVEENHHFHKEGEKFFRVSKIYREVIDKKNGNVIEKNLIWDNHSEVMFDYNLIPKDLIR